MIIQKTLWFLETRISFSKNIFNMDNDKYYQKLDYTEKKGKGSSQSR